MRTIPASFDEVYEPSFYGYPEEIKDLCKIKQDKESSQREEREPVGSLVDVRAVDLVGKR